MNYPSDRETRNEAVETAERQSKAAATQPEVSATDTAGDKHNVVEITIDEKEKLDSNVLKLSRTYSFEGKTISEIDLSKLADMNALQMQRTEALYRKIAKNLSASPETTIDYALAAVHIVTGLPIEFLQRLKARDAVAIKNKNISFLYGSDEE